MTNDIFQLNQTPVYQPQWHLQINKEKDTVSEFRKKKLHTAYRQITYMTANDIV
jgi:hypothetical protein